ncbi:hypothetical protein Y1Q_0021387 [Alligator mississippiensis]|uniref:Uncharacterized protein n=1 Tax=Alligator mississippiensis TaxID=8496 RepID=A0A151P9H0_ALLMI|nr:hypothetical protein Y1Q_0021387 [Alligator mississippiensis]
MCMGHPHLCLASSSFLSFSLLSCCTKVHISEVKLLAMVIALLYFMAPLGMIQCSSFPDNIAGDWRYLQDHFSLFAMVTSKKVLLYGWAVVGIMDVSTTLKR